MRVGENEAGIGGYNAGCRNDDGIEIGFRYFIGQRHQQTTLASDPQDRVDERLLIDARFSARAFEQRVTL